MEVEEQNNADVECEEAAIVFSITNVDFTPRAAEHQLLMCRTTVFLDALWASIKIVQASHFLELCQAYLAA